MNPSTQASEARLPFLDNLRSLMVIFVLLFHSGASYGSAVLFWPFHEPQPSILIDLFMLLGDVFMMAVLFFIAGYFALPSYQNRGSRNFFKEKFKRLGIPWLVVIVLVLPAMDYVHYAVQAGEHGEPIRSFGNHWLFSMKKILEFRIGWMDMTNYRNMADHFYQRYMWFISLLLLFFIVFAAVVESVQKLNLFKKDKFFTSSKGILLIIVGSISILLFGAVRFLVYPEFMGMGWFSLGNLIQFQCGKLVIYVLYFALGCCAYSNQWFTHKDDLGNPWGWAVACFVLFGANMGVMMHLNRAVNPQLFHKILFVILYPLWTLSFLGMFVGMAIRYWHTATPLNRELASHSYNMYLVHYIFPMMLPLWLSRWTHGPIGVKFILVGLLTVVLSYMISRFIVKRFPAALVLGLILFCIGLAVATWHA